MVDPESSKHSRWQDTVNGLFEDVGEVIGDGLREVRSMGKQRIPPRVFLAKRVVRKMAQGAALYPDEETAEALIGLEVPTGSGEPDLYILDTIAPEHSNIERDSYMVEQGDDLQDEIMYWLSINWKRFPEMRQPHHSSANDARWDNTLRYLGDWHKQPGEMFWPSQGDLETALEIIHDDENDMPRLIAPIVTIAPPWDEETGPPGDEFDLYVLQDDGPIVRINFWYLTREMRAFVAARPEVLEDDRLPVLPALAWHLTDHQRFLDEYERLRADGLAVSVVEWDADESPPLEVCFMVGRMGGEQVLILVTSKDYPDTPPAVRAAPMIQLKEGEDMFERLWAESHPLDPDDLPDGWAWSPEGSLLDLVKAVEGREA